MDEPTTDLDDDELVDAVFDAAFGAVSNGASFDVTPWLVGRQHLRARAEAAIALAQQSVGQKGPMWPMVEGHQLVGELGQGAMGRVYRAVRLRDGVTVAMKVLPPALFLSVEARQRFAAEAAALQRLRHPHVVAIGDVVETHELCAFTMDLVPGLSMAQLLGRLAARAEPTLADVAGALGARDLPDQNLTCFWLRVGAEMASALQAVHDQGLLHRDLKPGNVLVRRDGKAFLSDFGLARDPRWSQHTSTGALVGTPAYAAPEQLRGDKIDARTDVYGLGATLYEAVTRQRPFTEDHPTALRRAVEAARLRPPRQLAPELPRDLEAVLLCALAPERERRYATAAAMGEDLERILRLEPVLARLPSLGLLGARLLRRHRVAFLATLATTVVLLAAFVFGLVWWNERAAIPARVAAHIRQARLQLLVTEMGSNLWCAQAGFKSSLVTEVSGARLVAARREYQAAAALASLPAGIAAEAEVVTFAAALVRGEPGRVHDDLLTRYGAAFACWQTIGRSVGMFAEPLQEVAPASRRSLGLLAYLCNDAQTAVAAWERLDLAPAADAFVDGAMGMSLLAADQPARAWPRLLRAAEAFPEAGCLMTAVADAALRCGDLPVAEQFLAASRTLGMQDRAASRERVSGDLALARGDFAAAVAAFAEVDMAGNPLGGERLAAVQMRQGHFAAAATLLLQRGRRSARDDLLDQALVGWWRDLDPCARGSAVLGHLGLGRDAEQPLLAALCRRLHGEPLSVDQDSVFVRRWRPWFLFLHWAATDGRSLALYIQNRITAMHRSLRLLFGSSLLLPAFAPPLVAQTPPSWTQRFPATTLGTRVLHGMVYDSHRARSVLFGGNAWYNLGTPFQDTWEWDGANWQQVATANAPPVRANPSMAFDSGRNVVVLFGGEHWGTHYSDTWEYNGTNWTQRFPATVPTTGKVQAAMCYDSARSRVVKFGGWDHSGTYSTPPVTWEYDGVDWLLRTPAHSPPGMQYQGSMAYDPVRQRSVHCGAGTWNGSNFVPVREVWEWDGLDWMQVPSGTYTAPRFTPVGTMWHAPSQKVLAISVGWGTGVCQVWSWDGSLWRPLCTSSIPDPAPYLTQPVFHAAGNHVVMYGGARDFGATNGLGDTWVFDAGTPAAAGTSSMGTGCPGSVGVPNLQAISPPVVGLTFEAQLTNVAPGVAIFCLGWSNTQWNALPLPMPLGVLGLGPACTNYTSIDTSVWSFHAGVADYSLTVPCDPAFYGMVLYMQGASLDFALSTPIPVAVSNGLQVTFGG